MALTCICMIELATRNRPVTVVFDPVQTKQTDSRSLLLTPSNGAIDLCASVLCRTSSKNLARNVPAHLASFEGPDGNGREH